MPRLFVAVWPPEPVMEWLRGLPRPDVEGVRWTREEQWHATLRFFGSLDDSEVPSVCAALDRAGRLCGPASVVLGRRWARFGSAVALTLDGLDGVTEAVASETQSFGDRPRRGPSRGHITLARTRARRARVRLPDVGSVSWTASSVALVRSELGRGHGGTSLYTNVSVHQLG